MADEQHHDIPAAQTAPTTMVRDTPKCYLTSVAAEVRNAIYAEVFKVPEGNGQVLLVEAKPPEKTLLLTCRQVYEEARGMYRKLYREYWAETRFTILTPGVPIPAQLGPAAGASWSHVAFDKYYSRIRWMAEDDIAHITKLRIDQEADKQSWVWGDGLWRWLINPRQPSYPRAYIPVHSSKMQYLREEGYTLHRLNYHRFGLGIAYVDASRFREEDWEEGKEDMQATSLAKDELLALVHLVAVNKLPLTRWEI